MTDLSAGEHIVDGLEIERRHMRRRLALMPLLSAPNHRAFNGWTLNGVALADLTLATTSPLISPLQKVTDQMAHSNGVSVKVNVDTSSLVRHPSSQRFHDMLGAASELAYRLDAELAPAGASAWGVAAWVVPMRRMEHALRALQAVVRGDRTARSPLTLLLEVSALAMVARKYYTDDFDPFWAQTYTASMGETHDRKQSDYGTSSDPFHNVRASDAWQVAPWVGAMVRLSDKVNRLQTFAQKGALANESALDSLIDISVYALIARVLYEDETCG